MKRKKGIDSVRNQTSKDKKERSTSGGMMKPRKSVGHKNTLITIPVTKELKLVNRSGSSGRSSRPNSKGLIARGSSAEAYNIFDKASLLKNRTQLISSRGNKTIKPKFSQNNLFAKSLAQTSGLMAKKSKSPETSRARRNNNLTGVQNIYIRNSTLVNQLVNSRLPVPKAFSPLVQV